MPEGFDWRQLLALAPMAVAGIKGGGPAMGSFGEGYSRGRAVLDEMTLRQRAQAAREAAEQYAQSRDLVGDQRYAEEQKRRDAEQVLRVLEGLRDLPNEAASVALAAGVDDPEVQTQHAKAYSENAVDSIIKALPHLNLSREMLLSRVGDVSVPIKQAHLKKMSDWYGKLEAQNLSPEQWKQMRDDPNPRWGNYRLADIERILSTIRPPAQGQIRPLQSKNVRGTLDGKPFEGMANYDPVSGKYVVDGKPLAGVKDAPPAPTVQVVPQGDLPYKTRTRVDSKTKAFENEPAVKRFKLVAESVGFVNALSDTTQSPSDDQALIYAFAKAMDPDSVVREGEYATVQKYAQSWAESMGFNALRVIQNSEFLTPEARRNMKTTIRTKGAALMSQYRAVRKQYAGQINRITGSGDGEDYLIDYSEIVGDKDMAPGAGGAPKDGDPVVFPDGSTGYWDAKAGRAVKGTRR